jgi:hypothetical protein
VSPAQVRTLLGGPLQRQAFRHRLQPTRHLVEAGVDLLEIK